MDDIQLKNVITFNVQNNELTRFVVDQLNTKEIKENIVNIKKMKKAENQLQYTQTSGAFDRQKDLFTMLTFISIQDVLMPMKLLDSLLR